MESLTLDSLLLESLALDSLFLCVSDSEPEEAKMIRTEQ